MTRRRNLKSQRKDTNQEIKSKSFANTVWIIIINELSLTVYSVLFDVVKRAYDISLKTTKQWAQAKGHMLGCLLV